uniref:Uncharacterized protein n=1 Tax=Zea mays TaxID=4577 RepID=C4IY69_MAIZE|nr:unknown [Zea mays]
MSSMGESPIHLECDGGVLDVTPFLKASRLSPSWPRRCLRLMLSLLDVWIAGRGGIF